ncbi:type II secretion system protein [bacterium]|nr:type II secretion system protein [bacterium]
MRNKKGFTLIELLIVIAIIGVLSAALLPSILNAPARGRDAARLGNINSIVAALEAYNSDNGHYPNSTDAKNGTCIGTGKIFDTGLTAYFSGGIAPKDPSGAGRTIATGLTDPGDCVKNGEYYYKYIGSVDSAEYVIGTVMEIAGNNNTKVNPKDVSATTTPDPGSGNDYYILVQ